MVSSPRIHAAPWALGDGAGAAAAVTDWLTGAELEAAKVALPL